MVLRIGIKLTHNVRQLGEVADDSRPKHANTKITLNLKKMISNTKLSRNLAKLMLVAVLFVGCKEVNQTDKKDKAETVNDYEVSNQGVQILEIDGCQYVWCKNGYGAGLTHKGNCKFCLVRSAK